MEPKASIFFVPYDDACTVLGIDDGVALLELHIDLTNRGYRRPKRDPPRVGREGPNSDVQTPSISLAVGAPPTAARRTSTTDQNRSASPIMPGTDRRHDESEHDGLDAAGHHLRVAVAGGAAPRPCGPRGRSAMTAVVPDEDVVAEHQLKIVGRALGEHSPGERVPFERTTTGRPSDRRWVDRNAGPRRGSRPRASRDRPRRQPSSRRPCRRNRRMPLPESARHRGSVG